MILLYALVYFFVGILCLAVCDDAWILLNESGYLNHKLAILLALLWPLVLIFEALEHLRSGYLRVRNWMWHRKRLRQ